MFYVWQRRAEGNPIFRERKTGTGRIQLMSVERRSLENHKRGVWKRRKQGPGRRKAAMETLTEWKNRAHRAESL